MFLKKKVFYINVIYVVFYITSYYYVININFIKVTVGIKTLIYKSLNNSETVFKFYKNNVKNFKTAG